MGLCAPTVVTANAALEGSATDNRLVVVPGQLVEVAGVFQLMGRIGQCREGHAVPCKADAYVQSAAGDRCAVHVGAAAALLRIDRGVLSKILPDIVAPSAHFAACGAVGGGFPGAKTQIGYLGQLPAQREEQTELRQFSARALPCHGDITAACAVINGGYLVQPHVVKQVLDADGNIVENVEPEVKRQVLSAETSATMRELLTRSVNMRDSRGDLAGGNKTGYVAGYKAGGKSGTSQRKQALKDEEQTYYSSYWGFAPGDDPQIAVLVMLDTPHDEQRTYYGGRLAAPVVQNVLDEALQTLGVPKEYTEAELAKVETAVPNVVGSSVNAAAGKLRESGFNVDIERATGDTVLYQYPAAGTIVPRQSTIILYSEDRSESGGDLVTVPNLTDMSYDAACATLKSLGLNVSEKGVKGGGSTIVVTEQDIAADTQVEIGSVIEVTFHDTTVLD